MLLKLIEDNGVIVNGIIWLLILIFVLLICITILKLIQLCIACHQFANRTVYSPIYSAYQWYKDYMQIAPLPPIYHV
ncbi:small envelope protein [BtMr-AlphaCoV/SAX2011]|uniref:Envelope small membrane protein n=3 Tax=Orthocoronavirinae TaxID=2501931 RepID=A0A0U1WHE1_9ALPC|nr:small envelope protein [BtMr-AlphaCoV/SAX2011]AIA62248.1 small envelope protein [BtMr-AlphaCoV/SAX2011]WCC63885.1 envelope protein [Bat Coronavirus McGD16]WCZ55890.1 MAG: E [Myotis ricketti alphacoronavirus] [Myotis ricketti alphacoronavirus]